MRNTVVLTVFAVALLALCASTLGGQTYSATQITNAYAANDISTTGTDQTANLVVGSTTLGIADEGKLDNTAIGFTFNFFAAPFTTLDVSVNGFLCFNDINASTYTLPAGIPNTAVPDAYIAGVWRDMGSSTTLPVTAKLYTQTLGTAPNRRFVVQFVAWPNYNAGPTNDFLYVLYETTNVIECHYGTVQAVTFCTGVEDVGATLGVASAGGFSRATAPTLADRFTPATVAPDINFLRGTTAVADGGTDTLTGTFVETVPSAITYTIQNPGTGATTLTNPAAITNMVNCNASITTQPATSIAVGGSTTTVLSVTPIAAGAFSFDYALTNSVSAKNPYNFSVNGTAVTASPDIAFLRGTTAVADGGTDALTGTFIGTVAATITYTIQNPGNAPTTITNPAAITNMVNCSVTITTQPATSIAAAGSTTTVLSVVPGAAGGAFSFDYALTNGVTAKNPYNFTASGTATAGNPDIAFLRGTTAVADGGTDALTGTFIGTVATTVTYTIQNPGNAPTAITNPAAITNMVNCAVTITTQPATSIAAAGSTTTVLSVVPGAAGGAFSFDYALTNSVTAKNPYNFTVSGTATAANPDIAFLRGTTAVADGGTDALGSAFIGTVATTVTYTIQNPGNAPTTITNPAAITNMVNCSVTITTQPATSIAAAGSTTTVLSVTPSAAGGAFSFDYALTNGVAAKNPYNFTASGTATAANPDLTFLRGTTTITDGGTDAVTGAFVAGSATQVSYTIQNPGNVSTTVTNPAAFTNLVNCGVTIVTQPAASIAAAGSTTTVLAITPAASGAFSFDYALTNSVTAKNPYNFSVSGTAAASGPLAITLGTQGTGNAFPFNFSPTSGRFQSAYAATELTAAAGKYITMIRVFGSTLTPPQYGNLRVRLAHTTLGVSALTANFETNYTSPLVTVLGPVNYTPAATVATGGSWYTFVLASPFLYNGTSGLLVDWSYDTRSGTGFSISSATGRSRIYMQGGNAISPTGTASSTSGNYGIEFTYQAGAVDGTGISHNTTADSTLTLPATDKVVMDMNLMTIGSARDLTSLTFTRIGTITDAQVTSLKLVRDNNNNGVVEGTDTVLGSGTLSGGVITFSGTPLQAVTTAAQVRLLLAATIPVGPGGATTIQFTLNSAASVSWSGGTDFNVYPIVATSFVVFAPEINVVRVTTNIADGGTDTISGFAIGNPSTVTYTIQNTGNQALTLTNPATVLNQVNCAVTITTAPAASVAAAGSTTTVLTITPSATSFSFDYSIGNSDSDENPYDFSVNGSAVAPNPELDVLRGTTAIPDGGTDNLTAAFYLGTPGTVTYTFQSTGNVPVTLSNPAALGSQTNCSVTITTAPAASIAPAGSSTTVLTITPSAATWSFTYSIGNNDANENPYDWTITGTATTPVPEMDVFHGVLPVANGSTDIANGLQMSVAGPVTFTIQNNGVSTLTMSNPVIGSQTGCSVTITTPPPATLAASASVNTVLTVTVTSANFSFTYSIDNNDSNENPYSWTVVGKALTPLTGTYVINQAGGAGVDYRDIGAAFDDLEKVGVAGPTLLSITDSATYTSTVSYTLGINAAAAAVTVAGVSATNTITLKPATGQTPKIQGNATGANLQTPLTGRGCLGIMTSFVTVEGLETFGGPNFGILIQGNNTTLNPVNNTIRRCIVHDIPDGPGIAYMGQNSAYATNILIEHNFVWNCFTNSVPSTTLLLTNTYGSITWRNAAQNSGTVRHNTIVHTSTFATTGGIYAYSSSTTYAMNDLNNNIVVCTSATVPALFLSSTTSAPTVANCNRNVWFAATHCNQATLTPFATWQTTGRDVNGSNANPNLVSTSTPFNLHLALGSLCIDPAGQTSTATIDIDGDTRPQGAAVDIGADEYFVNSVAPTITSGAPANGVVGTAYSHTFTATGVPTTFTWSIIAGALPPGLTLNATTGAFAGTPVSSGNYSFTVSCSNTVAPDATQAVNMTINQAPAFSSGTPAGGSLGTAYSHTFTATGFPASFTYSVISGSLPAGLALGSSSGILSGTPTASGVFAFTVQCSNGISPAATQNVNLTITEAPLISSGAPVAANVGVFYSHTFTATGFPVSFTWTLNSGTLPAGLSLNATTGVLSGTPTTSGVSSFVVGCANGVSPNDSQGVNLTVNAAPTPPSITSGAPAAGIVGIGYSHTFTASGFPASFTWSVLSGSLPAGLSLNASTGVLSGTPTTAGTSSFTVNCSNGASPDATQNVNLDINQAPTITSAAPANGTVGSAYSHSYAATGFPTTFTWTVIAGALPTGLTLNASSGLLSGTPTTGGAFSATVRCANGVSPAATQVANININQQPAITSGAPASGLFNTSYSHTFVASGFPATFTWTVISGATPTGLTLNATSGVLSGTPTASGAFSFTVQCSNGVGTPATQVVNMNINQAPSITSGAPAVATFGSSYSHTFTASGFPASFTWTLSAGSLPGGLALNASSGALSGTPTVSGNFSFTVQAANGVTPNGTQAVNLTINRAPTITSAAPANGLVGTAYSHTFVAAGFPTAFTWSVTSGSLPTGLTLNSTSGLLSGTPTVAGAATFTVQCANGISPDGTQAVNMNINQAPSITSAAPANGLVGTTYSHTFTATGFPASFTWSVSAGTLPGGLTLGATTGVLSGTPTAGGAFSFTVQCSNTISPNGTQAVNMNVNQQPAITSAAPANAIVGMAYTHTFVASGFPVTFTWSVSSGTLPGGLALNASSGVMSGTPTAAGAFSFTVQCSNGVGTPATQNVNMNVTAAPTITSAAPPSGIVGVAYTHTFTATGSPATFTWSVSAGTLPAGLTLNATSGVLSGTPTALGASSFTVQCSNGVNPDATQAVNLSIGQAPSITSGAPAPALMGVAYTHTFTASGFPATFTWSVSSGTLPAGLALNASSGVLSGTPTVSGATSFTVSCDNGVSPVATQLVNFTVNAAPGITSAAPASGVQFTAYTHTYTGSGFPTNFTWTVSSGALPTGLALGATTGAISGTPTVAGSFSGVVTCSNGISPNATQGFNIVIAATAAPDMAVTRGLTAVADGGMDLLGNVLFGMPQTATFTVTNSGTSALNLTGTPGLVQVTAGANVTSIVVTTPPAATVAAAASTTFAVSYTVTAAGAFSFTVSIANTDPHPLRNPYDWTSSGTGTGGADLSVMRGATAIADGGTDNLGTVNAGSASGFTYTLNSTGNTTLTITTPVTVSSALNCSVVITTQPGTSVASSTSTTMVIAVTPTAPGSFSFALSVANNSLTKSPYNWTVSGVAPAFGGSKVGSSGGGGGCTASDGTPQWTLLLIAAATLVVISRVRRRKAN